MQYYYIISQEKNDRDSVVVSELENKQEGSGCDLL